MAFNLGIDGLSQFRQMLVAIADRDYDTAAREMEDSEAARQAPARYARLSAAMSSGVAQ